MSVDPQAPYRLAYSYRECQGQSTDQLAGVIRRRLPDFLAECEQQRICEGVVKAQGATLSPESMGT